MDELTQPTKYPMLAFVLVLESLPFVESMVKEGKIELSNQYDRGPKGHISAAELCRGFIVYLQETYGRLGQLLCDRAGIRTSDDLGLVVEHLVKDGMLNASDEDKTEDFNIGLDIVEALEPGFLALQKEE